MMRPGKDSADFWPRDPSMMKNDVGDA